MWNILLNRSPAPTSLQDSIGFHRWAERQLLCSYCCNKCKMWTRLVGAVLLNLVLLLHGAYGDDSCGIGIETGGMTIPRGDIILEYGNPFRLMCILNTNHSIAVGKNVSDMHIFRDDKEVPAEFLTVINSTTLEVYIEKPPISSSMYYCKMKIGEEYTALCLNRVVIERKPQEVQNFSCISRNWQNLTCSWKKPPSYVNTSYNLTFRLPGRAGGRMHYKCPNITGNETDGKCFWDIKTDPHYRQPYEYYYFTLTGSNMFGNWTKQIKFHHYSHVLPAPTTDLVVNTSSHSALLKWKVPFPMQLFPPGLLHKMEYQSQWDSPTTWHIANTSSLPLHGDNYTYNLNGLKYANSLYDVRVYIRSPLAVGEDKWSQPTMTTFRTKPTVPSVCPKVDIGSFEVSGGLPNRDVYIYWQRIPDYLKNGDYFQYKVTEVEENGEKRCMSPDEITNAYAKFRGISYNSFRFVVVASNEIGHSEDKSIVYVPSKTESPPEPVSFTKIAFGGGKYELSWKPPQEKNNRNKIENYTIFWCDHERDRPFQCTGYLNWTHVPSTETIKIIQVPENRIYQFAISANTRNASSGMVWASCTVIFNKVVGKMKSVWINSIGSTFIEVGWKLDCSDRIGTVQGFNIYYCPIVSPYNLTCREEVMNKTVLGDPQTLHGSVQNLKPYTMYMVAVAVITHNGEGLQSEPLYNTTYEAAPSRPEPVVISNVTNTSMVVTWKPPASTNGFLRYYDIYYNQNKKKIELDKSGRDAVLQTTLTNLTSYYNYSVSVSACTIACSEKSPPVTVQTDIGVPGEMERPTVQGINSSMVLVSWIPPSNPGGLLNYYEIAVIKVDSHSKKNHSIIRNFTGIAYGNSSMVSVPNCRTEGYLKYLFLVRAVNIGTNNVTYYGNWSSPGESNCYASVLPQEVIVVIWICGVIVLLALVILFCYLGKRAWLRCKQMQDVEVKLPPGLATSEKEKDDHEYWPPVETREHLTGKPRSNAPADEELLLQKKEERHGRNPSGDSSGCSSGHESVSSSLTSGTQCSSDSGTEVDQHPPSPDGVFPDSPTWESSSLRQRNVGSLRPDGSSDGSRWDPYVKMGKNAGGGGGGGGGTGSVARSTPNLTELDGPVIGTGGYTCLGTWSSTGYISMPSSEEMGGSGGSGGYCRVGLDAHQAEGQNPQQQVAQPNKGYVSLASMMDTSPSTSTAHSSVHSSPRQPTQSPQPRGYVTHHPLWSASKETSAGKGYVMAGELANKVPVPSELEEENQGILDETADEGLHSPELYCRFGLRPGAASTVVAEPEQERTSGYVTLPETRAAPQEERRVGVSGGCGYVPHRQFEKRDTMALSQSAYQDHSDQPYTKVYPPSTSV